MEYLLRKDIILINRMTIERHGGNFVLPFNFLNESPLDYLVEAVQSEMFGAPLYPEIYDKAGLYMFNIISNHIFQDGNKRTGLQSALLFLKLNNYHLKKNINFIEIDTQRFPSKGESPNKILTEFVIEVASSKINLEICQNWFKENITAI